MYSTDEKKSVPVKNMRIQKEIEELVKIKKNKPQWDQLERDVGEKTTEIQKTLANEFKHGEGGNWQAWLAE